MGPGVPILRHQKPFSLFKDWAPSFPCFFSDWWLVIYTVTKFTTNMIFFLVGRFLLIWKEGSRRGCTNTERQPWIEDVSWMEERSKKYDCEIQDGWLCLNCLSVISIGWFAKDVYIFYIYLHCFCLMSRGFSQLKNSEHVQECFLFGSA